MIIRELFARLGWQVDRASVNQAEAAVERVRDRAQQATTQLQGFGRSLRRFFTGILAVVGGVQLSRFIGSTLTETEQLRAIMETVTDSAEEAAAAFAFIESFATQTPDQLEQVANAFIRLRGAGIEPTEELLTGLGNVAATMGKSLDEIVEASQNAARGMPKMLEGILRFDISGRDGSLFVELADQTVEVGQNIEDVLGFLNQLGQTRFAGGMELQMQRLGGSVSNLRVSVRAFVRAMGDAGLTGALTRLVQTMTEASVEGEGLAITLGRTLATGVDILTESIEFLRENSERVKDILFALGAAAALSRVAALGTALRLAFAPINLAAAKFLLLFVLIEDIVAFFQGRDSLIGRLFGVAPEEVSGVIGGIVAAFEPLIEPFERLLTTIGGIVTQAGPTFLAAVVGWLGTFANFVLLTATIFEGIAPALAVALVAATSLIDGFVRGSAKALSLLPFFDIDLDRITRGEFADFTFEPDIGPRGRPGLGEIARRIGRGIVSPFGVGAAIEGHRIAAELIFGRPGPDPAQLRERGLGDPGQAAETLLGVLGGQVSINQIFQIEAEGISVGEAEELAAEIAQQLLPMNIALAEQIRDAAEDL